MSARITLHCDTVWQFSACIGQLITDAVTLPEARQAACRVGWRTHANGKDYCANCSGRGIQPAVNVVHLYPDRG